MCFVIGNPFRAGQLLSTFFKNYTSIKKKNPFKMLPDFNFIYFANWQCTVHRSNYHVFGERSQRKKRLVRMSRELKQAKSFWATDVLRGAELSVHAVFAQGAVVVAGQRLEGTTSPSRAACRSLWMLGFFSGQLEHSWITFGGQMYDKCVDTRLDNCLNKCLLIVHVMIDDFI